MGNEGVEALCEVLPRMTKLEKIGLGNEVTPRGFDELSKAILHCPNLRHIEAHNSNIRGTAITNMKTAIACLPKMQTVNIDNQNDNDYDEDYGGYGDNDDASDLLNLDIDAKLISITQTYSDDRGMLSLLTSQGGDVLLQKLSYCPFLTKAIRDGEVALSDLYNVISKALDGVNIDELDIFKIKDECMKLPTESVSSVVEEEVLLVGAGIKHSLEDSDEG